MSDESDKKIQQYLASIEESMRFLARVEQRRYREMTPKNGSNMNMVELQAGATQSELMNWPSGGGDDECSPCLETVTIDIDWEFINDPSVSEGRQAGIDSIDLATLTVCWGSIGHKAEFDLMRGMSVTVSGYKVLVSASYARAPILVLENNAQVVVPQPRLNVRASLAPGTKHYGGIVGNARFTVNLGSIDAGATSPKVEIPSWAKEIGIANTDVTIPTMTLDQFANANNAAVTRSRGTVGKGSADTMPRESFSSWVSVTNTSGSAVSAKLIFYLGR